MLLLKPYEPKTPSIPNEELIQKISDTKKFLDQNQLEDAQRTAKDLINACEFCVPGYLALMEVAEKKSEYWDVIEQYERIHGLLPDLPVILIRVANTEYAMKAFELAECTVRRAIAVDPNNGSSYFLLAQIQKGLENYDAAIESARKAIALG